ncbi:hypothetical protein ACIHCQ_32495 [Streptomyces sp. NPDC052236]|uniref:hypothetical protein n=1 Tax=Streptomyces sp. NPDC052236 TaxID=3365686 RepID=UPI0037D506DB
MTSSEQGHPVRAFVRQDDERAHSLRQAGAEVFVNISEYEQSFMSCRRRCGGLKGARDVNLYATAPPR